MLTTVPLCICITVAGICLSSDAFLHYCRYFNVTLGNGGRYPLIVHFPRWKKACVSVLLLWHICIQWKVITTKSGMLASACTHSVDFNVDVVIALTSNHLAALLNQQQTLQTSDNIMLMHNHGKIHFNRKGICGALDFILWGGVWVWVLTATGSLRSIWVGYEYLRSKQIGLHTVIFSDIKHLPEFERQSEHCCIVTPTQSGFRKGRSTTDQLVRLESFVREAFIQKQHATAIFFDLEKAYDTCLLYTSDAADE